MRRGREDRRELKIVLARRIPPLQVLRPVLCPYQCQFTVRAQCLTSPISPHNYSMVTILAAALYIGLSLSSEKFHNHSLGVKGRMWRVIKRMYEASRSAVLLDGEKSASFSVEQGVPQGRSLSPILFSVFINDLLKEVEKAELGIHLGEGGELEVCCLQMIS